MSHPLPSPTLTVEAAPARLSLGPGWGLMLACFLVLPSQSPAVTLHREKAVTTYQRALRLWAELESRPQHARPAADYIKLIRTFQAVYEADSTYERSPAALANAAQLREEMGWEFSEKGYYTESIKAYQFLIAQYPQSGVARDSMFAIGEIYRVDLNEPAEARRAFKKFLSQYPTSTKARFAREKLRQIDAIEAREKAPSVPVRDAATRPEPATTEASEPDLSAPAPEVDGRRLVEVTGVRFWVGSDYTRVVIALEDEAKFTSVRLSHPDRLVFDLSNSRLSPALTGKTFPVEDGFLRQVRIAQYQPTVTRAVLDVKKVGEYSVFSLPNPFRLVIDIHGGSTSTAEHGESYQDRMQPNQEEQPAYAPQDRQAAPRTAGSSVRAQTEGAQPGAAARGERTASGGGAQLKETAEITPAPAITPRTSLAAPTAGPASPRQTPQVNSSLAARAEESALPATAGPRTLTRVLGLKIGRIVIDPGHGGHDQGTSGPRGLHEKDLVLDVGLRLKALLERKTEAEVVMTRSDDTFIPLEERTAIANQKGADLFISIHANASRDESARGIETYYLNFASDPNALEVAARENASSAQSVHELQSLVKKIVLTEKIKESQDFAVDVQRSVYTSLVNAGARVENRGVKRAPFVVLIGANMPSILAEISFLTNSRDEKLLRRPEYRQKIAEALYRGIEQYTRNLGGIRVAEKSWPPPRDSQPRRNPELPTRTTAESIPAGMK